MHIKISNRTIGESSPTFVIAELSANHLQRFDIAVATIKEIKACGADAVKLQTYTADTITLDCDNEYFRIKQGSIWDGQLAYDLYKSASTPWDWQPRLKEIAESEGLICFSSPFDKTAVDFLEKMDVPAYKVASFEINDIPLIEHIASTGKPVIISIGIGTLDEIHDAIHACHSKGNRQVALLKCTSAYPAPVEEANLLTIPDMQKRFKTVVGLSDHTMGTDVSVAAVAIGARIIEKHFILERSMGGPDAAFSMEPREFRQMVGSIRNVEKALGSATYEFSEKTKKSRQFCRSIFVVKDMKAGDAFTEDNVRSIRPGHGLQPKYYGKVLGKRANQNISRGTPLKLDMVSA